MADISDGGPAFPMSGDPNVEFDRGMSLRDYFAGQLLIGLGPIIAELMCSTRRDTLSPLARMIDETKQACCNEDDPDVFVGDLCYQYSDAMIDARKSGGAL